jgi:hypothetical protein
VGSLIALDYLRVFVLGQVAVIVVLFALSIVQDGLVLLRTRDVVLVDAAARRFVLGKIASRAGILVLMIQPVLGVVHRFGQHHLDSRTPTLQLALLLFWGTWAWADRATIEPTVAGAAAEAAVKSELPPEAHGP